MIDKAGSIDVWRTGVGDRFMLTVMFATTILFNLTVGIAAGLALASAFALLTASSPT